MLSDDLMISVCYMSLVDKLNVSANCICCSCKGDNEGVGSSG